MKSGLVEEIVENPYFQYFIGLPGYQTEAPFVAVERAFALAKHSYGLGLVITKRGETTRSSIALSILAMNLGRSIAGSLLHFLCCFFRCEQRENTLKFIQNKCYENLAAC